jgi:hypothetical protein
MVASGPRRHQGCGPVPRVTGRHCVWRPALRQPYMGACLQLLLFLQIDPGRLCKWCTVSLPPWGWRAEYISKKIKTGIVLKNFFSFQKDLKFLPSAQSNIWISMQEDEMFSQVDGCRHPEDRVPSLLAEVSSGAVTCPSVLNLTSLLRWAPTLPRVMRLRRCHVSHGSGLCLPERGAPVLSCITRPLVGCGPQE